MPDERKTTGRTGRTVAAVALLALLSASAVWGIDAANLLRPLQLKAYDGLYWLSVATRTAPERAAAPVAVVAIDDATFADETFKIPQTLWHRLFAAVIGGLADGGASVIGLDFLLPQALFDDLVPDYSRTWLKTLVYARSRGAPVVTGLVQAEGRRIMPQPRYLQIIGSDRLGLFNLTTDPDDFIRRQRLFFPAADDPAKGLYSVTFLLARAVRPDLAPPAETVYIDYDPVDPSFPRYSCAEVYHRAVQGDREWLRERFANKIVLIGETDTLTQDRHATPLYHLVRTGHRRTPGVEILAHTVSTLLRGDYFADIGAGLRFLIYLALALPVAFYTVAGRRRWLLLLTPVLTAAWIGLSLAAFVRYVVPPLVGGLTVILVGQAAAFAYRHWVVDREKRFVRGAFTRYLSPDVVAQIVDHPDMLALGGRRRIMTAFFSDLAGFTGISESLSPEELVQLLNRYLSRMTRVILDHGGTVDKFEGDAIMAFWGAPLDQEDHALHACLAALDQQARLAAFRRETSAPGRPDLHARMGINTGPMIVGNMGSEERFDYTVMGDAVNLASRLEGANKMYGTGIMISEQTWDMVRGRVEARELDFLRVKGKVQPIRVYELLARNGELTPEKAAVRSAFERGLDRYRRRDFEAAETAFRQALETDPLDGPSRAFLERCRLFQDQPPPPDWDGVFTMTTK